MEFKITVGFSTTNKFMSRFIRWITRSPFSHAWIAFWDSALNMRFVMQAEAWGYELRPWNRWVKENRLMAELEPVGGNLDKSLQYISTFLGSKYDYKFAILMGLKSLFGRWINGKFQDPKKLLCTEGVVRFLKHGEYDAASDLDPEITNPKELFDACVNSKQEFKILWVEDEKLLAA